MYDSADHRRRLSQKWQWPKTCGSKTIIIGGCDTGVRNVMLGDGGCMMTDSIAECAGAAATHGAFVSCVAHLANEWKQDGLISGQEKGRIQRCAARADIP